MPPVSAFHFLFDDHVSGCFLGLISLVLELFLLQLGQRLVFLVLVDALLEPLHVAQLLPLVEELGLEVAGGHEADALIRPAHLHEPLDRQLLVEDARNDPQLPLQLLPPLLRQIGRGQNLVEHFALAFDVVDFQGFVQRLQLLEVLALHLLFREVVLDLGHGELLSDPSDLFRCICLFAFDVFDFKSKFLDIYFFIFRIFIILGSMLSRTFVDLD